MSIVSKPKIIIAAIASRPYVQAAVEAGYEVIAIDCFADLDTKHLAKKVYQVPMQNGGLDRNELLKLINGINSHGLLGLCYGAGFEMQPELLAEVHQVVPVIGNADEVVMVCKDPMLFFATCDALEVIYPEAMLDMPKSSNGWLQKTIGGSGGSHVKPADCCDVLENGVYYQKHQAGRSVACLFIANVDDVQMIGFHEQWLDGSAIAPYCYGGAVTQIEISLVAKARLTKYVAKLTKAIGLVGISSCDAIVNGDDVYVLEVNPRLSATIDLYVSEYPDLIERHVKACSKKPLRSLVANAAGRVSHAHLVIYAKDELVIEHGFCWPRWVADRPEDGSHFKAGMPVCTVFSEAESAERSRSLVQDRAITINKQLLN